jgi:hypothetical protein
MACFAVLLTATRCVRADAAAADSGYKFVPDQDVVYQIVIQLELPDKTKTTTSYLLLHPKSFDEINGQSTLTYNWRTTNTATTENGQTSSGGFPLNGDFFRAPNSADVVVDPRGTIVNEGSLGDDSQLEALQGPAWRLMLQPLPPAGQNSWSVHRQVKLYRIEQSQPSNPGFPPGFGGPPGFWGGPPGFGRPFFGGQAQNTTRIESPADESVTYTARAPKDDLVKVRRKYDLATLEKVGDTPAQHLVGDGQYVFDIKSGALSTLQFDLVEVVTLKNANVQVPITVTAHRVTADEVSKMKADAAATEAEQKEREVAAKQQAVQEHAAALPSADQQAAQLKKLADVWHAKGIGREVLATMEGEHTAPEKDQPTDLTSGEVLTTPGKFAPPVTFQIVAMTDLADTRIRYAFNQIIFNWEMRHDELRVDGGPGGRTHNGRFFGGGLHPKPGVGQLPSNEWVAIEFTVTRTEAILYVNGKEIDRLPGDYSQINQPFAIEAHNGPVDIKSIKVIK